MKKNIRLVFVVILALMLLFAVSATAAAAGPSSLPQRTASARSETRQMTNTATGILTSQGPVKALKAANMTDAINYESETLEPTGDGNAGVAAFFSWATLATYAGAVLFTTIATQYLKNISFMSKVPPQVTSYAVALLGLLCATLFSGNVTASGIVLCFVNAFVVALAANGAYDNIRGASEKAKQTYEDV